jgi:hypothetical protein
LGGAFFAAAYGAADFLTARLHIAAVRRHRQPEIAMKLRANWRHGADWRETRAMGALFVKFLGSVVVSSDFEGAGAATCFALLLLMYAGCRRWSRDRRAALSRWFSHGLNEHAAAASDKARSEPTAGATTRD